MTARCLHIKTKFIRQIRAAGVLLLGCFIIPVIATSQEGLLPESRLAFFEQKAMEDALYEQAMHWQTEEDELDYWTDQRNYEKALQQNQHHGYQVYIFSKRDAYRKHQESCDPLCGHGDYYQLQAAFYFQYSEPGNSSDNYIATSTAY